MKFKDFANRDRLLHIHTLSERYGSKNEHSYEVKLDPITGIVYLEIWRESDNGYRLISSEHDLVTFEEAAKTEGRVYEMAQVYLQQQFGRRDEE